MNEVFFTSGREDSDKTRPRIHRVSKAVVEIVGLAIAFAPLVGCDANKPPEAKHIELVPATSDLLFDSTPDTNYSAMTCAENPRSWASTSADVNSVAGSDSIPITIGAVSAGDLDAWKSNELRFTAGATFQTSSIGVLEVATSDNENGQSYFVDIADDQKLATILEGDEGYDIALTVRPDTNRAGERTASVTLNCLPSSLFDGGLISTPLSSVEPVLDESPETSKRAGAA